MKRAARYLRQSKDLDEGIDRQRDRTLALVNARGWVDAGEYVDNDTSASSQRGPETAWGRLLADRAAGRIDVVVAVDLDRLLRSTRDLNTLIDAGLMAVTVDGEIDLTTADGEFRATMLAGIARFETRRKAERQVRANEDRRLRGSIVKAGRPFGYEDDGITIRESEAELIRAAVKSITCGGSLYAITRAWNEAGVTTSLGKPWRTNTLRQMLMRPRTGGLIQHRRKIPKERPEDKQKWRVDVVGEFGNGIVPRAEWEAMRAVLEHPSRKTTTGPKVANLGSGILRCAVCDSPMRVLRDKRLKADGTPKAERYVCMRQNGKWDGQRHSSAMKDEADYWIVFHIIDLLMDSDDETDADAPELAALNVKRAELARQRAVTQQMAKWPGADLEAAQREVAKLAAQIEDLDIQIARAAESDTKGSLMKLAKSFLVPFADIHIRATIPAQEAFTPRFSALPMEEQRAILLAALGGLKLVVDERGVPTLR